MDEVDVEVLERVQRRVLWLAMTMVHHANNVRGSRSGVKVGGHQASSASVVSVMSALWFGHLGPDDEISVKPHASPVLHAINYLLGRLPSRYLTELRAFRGLQSYPSRTKDPDPVDFSTGSVGIGATATIWRSLARRYLASHFDAGLGGRQIALVGDAELDEGAIWEALVDPTVAELSRLLWVVDLNRQSLDRVVPGVAAGRLRSLFAAVGWNTITLKYGRRLRELFAEPGGSALERRIDAMSNEEYQHLLRSPTTELHDALAGSGPDRVPLLKLLDGIDNASLARALRDLGGHDLGDLLAAYRAADRVRDRPTVVFAYTIKAWRLPTEGHPGNHSALLSDSQWRELATSLAVDPELAWEGFPPESEEGRLCAATASRLQKAPPAPAAVAVRVPTSLGARQRTTESTQQAFGVFLTDLLREAPEVASRVVTVSPDVASSTNLGGWINRVGIWHSEERHDWFADDPGTLLHWRESGAGRHIELGIAEGNLVGLVGELGATWSRDSQPLLPIGTLYDPFVARALEPWSFGIYAGGQSILVGTPSGITLASEGGAHQSIITPSIGIEQPRCMAWEPAFSQDLEWAFLHALDQLGRSDGSSAYFRLSTRPIDQSLAALPRVGQALEERRRAVLAGGYRLRQADEPPRVTLVGMGAVMPEVLSAWEELVADGLPCDVVCLTSADLVFRATRARRALGGGVADVLDTLFPPDRAAPIVSVVDGHPHTLAFLAGVNATPISSLGVTDFGQVGDVDDLYRHYGIDTDTIVGAAWDLIDELGPRR